MRCLAVAARSAESRCKRQSHGEHNDSNRIAPRCNRDRPNRERVDGPAAGPVKGPAYFLVPASYRDACAAASARVNSGAPLPHPPMSRKASTTGETAVRRMRRPVRRPFRKLREGGPCVPPDSLPEIRNAERRTRSFMEFTNGLES